MDRSNHWITVSAVVVALFLWAVAPAASADAYSRLFEAQKKIAEAGDASGQLHLGEMYELGLGTQADHDAALKWYQKAAKQGHPLAKRRIEALRQAQDEERRDTALDLEEEEQTKTASVAPGAAPEAKPAPKVSTSAERKARREAKAKDDEARRRALVKQILARQRKNASDPFE